MLWGSPLMKASIIFSVFGTMFGHKTANSWNLLTPGDPIGLFYSDRLSLCIPPRQGIIGQGISLGPMFILGLLAFAMAAACASRAAATPSIISCQMVASVIAGKITVVILVRDKCPHGKGSLRIFLSKGLLLEIELLWCLRDSGGVMVALMMLGDTCQENVTVSAAGSGG
nr:hypothetical protein [Tanacetum cinerariifolium]